MRKIVVILNNVSWDFPCDYIRQNALELSSRAEVIIFNPFYFPTFKNLLFDGQKRQEWLAMFKIKGVTYFPTIGFFPFQRFLLIQKINTLLNCLNLRLYITLKFFPRKPIFWTFSPQATKVIKYIQWREALIYDRPDHVASVSLRDDLNMKKNEEKLIRSADIVFTNSPFSLRYVQKYNSESFLVPCGCAENLFRGKKNKLPQDLKNITKPRLGLVGLINHRVNLRLLYNLAAANKRWNIIIIGPIFDFDPLQSAKVDFYSWLTKIKKLPNVFFVGERAKNKIAGYINYCDVCLIPYDYTQEYVKGCNPMKFYEYLALGKPVVSTPIEALERYPSTAVKFATSGRGFSQKIALFLKKNNYSEDIILRKNIAKKNSWQKRIDVILGIINANAI